MLKDPTPVVRDSVAWLFGHICDLVPDAVDASVIPSLLEALYGSLDDEPRVAKNVCWVRVMIIEPLMSGHFLVSSQTISSLAEVAHEVAQNAQPESDTVPTYALSAAYSTIVGKLHQVATR
jgi:hypothetical protein